jgi:fatty acid desaturase
MRMDKESDKLLLILELEIEKKCFEIKRKRAEQRLTKLFVLACILFLTVPVLLAFIGVNLLSMAIPVVLFLVFAVLVLSPIILNKNLGGVAR